MKVAIFLLCIVSLSLAGELYSLAPLFRARASLSHKRSGNPTYLCEKFSCSNSTGASCGLGYNEAQVEISDTGCITGLGCSNTTNGTCVPLPTTVGAACIDQECGGNLTCDSNYTCVVATPTLNTYYPGQSCIIGVDLCYNNTDDNTQQNCTTGVCPFVPDGQNATKNGECNIQTSFWNSTSGTCTPYTPFGGNCSLNHYEQNCQYGCSPYSVNGTDGFCQGLYNLTVGAPCASATSCTFGLFCGFAANNTFYGVCTKPVASPTLGKPCIEDDNCTTTNAEFCSCATGLDAPVCTAHVLPAGYGESEIALELCVAAHGCNLGGTDSSCLLAACPYELCDLINATVNAPTYYYTGGSESVCAVDYYNQALCTKLPPRPTPSPPPTHAPTPAPTSTASTTSSTTSPTSSPTTSPTPTSTSASPSSSTSPILLVSPVLFAFGAIFVLLQ